MVGRLNAGEDWLGRWHEGRIGWHEQGGSAALKEFWPTLAPDSRVLVPLCGKTVDLLWLADRGLDVVGVELSEIAVEAFFAEQNLAFRRDDSGSLPAWTAVDKKLTVYCGDYFDFSCDPCDALFDRGALVALPETLRPAYAVHTKTLLKTTASQVLVTLEYEQQRVAGPPFSVLADEVLRYWPDMHRVCEHNDIAAAPPKFRQAELDEFLEVVWRTD